MQPEFTTDEPESDSIMPAACTTRESGETSVCHYQMDKKALMNDVRLMRKDIGDLAKQQVADGTLLKVVKNLTFGLVAIILGLVITAWMDRSEGSDQTDALIRALLEQMQRQADNAEVSASGDVVQVVP